jgi:type I restriction enzyme S subunit
LPTQRAIAHILGTLDDKIELNRRMNETLEAMARALFKSWFVDFDPVRAKAEGRAPSGMDAETAKLFPSELVDSDLGPIPKGWKAGRIGDVIEIHDSRRVPLSSREREQRRGHFPYYGATSVMDYVDAFLFDGRFVLVGEDGSVVTPEGLPFTQYVWGRFWVNNHAHVLTGIRGFSQEHLYLLFQQTNIAAYVTGAVQPKLSQGNMRKIPLVVAPDAVNAKFGLVLDPLFARFRALTEESRTLTRLRDEILPRLLSGKLPVDAAERAVEEVA